MAQVFFTKGVSNNLNSLPYKEGQLIFTVDDRHLYLDIEINNIQQRLKFSTDAETALVATYDSDHENRETISELYFASVSVSGTKLTFTKGTGATQTIDLQDTYAVFQIKGDNIDYPMVFSSAGVENEQEVRTLYVNKEILVNPSTKTITANLDGKAASADYADEARHANTAGSATTAKYDSLSNLITDTYFSEASIDGQTIRLRKGSGATITLETYNSDEKVKNEPSTSTKAYITGTPTATESIGSQVFDTGVYLTDKAGELAATTFKGKLEGNADTATKATGDGNGDNIRNTYIKNATIDSATNTITFTKGSGDTFSLKVKDDNTDTKVTTSVDTNSVGYITASTNASGQNGQLIIDPNIKFQNGTIEADFKGDLTGTADKAIKATGDEIGQAITTYVHDITSDSNGNLTITQGGGTSKTIANVDTKVTTSAASEKVYLAGTPTIGSNGGLQAKNTTYMDTDGSITAPTFKGTLSGNASTATSATKATNDGNNKSIADTYLSEVVQDGNSLTFKNGQGANVKTVTITDELVKQNEVDNEDATSYPLLLGNKNITGPVVGETYYNNDFTVVPSTNTINANISGNAGTADRATIATKAENDSAGNGIRNTYAATLEVSGKTLTLKNGLGGVISTVTTQDTNTDTKVTQTVVSNDADYPVLLAPSGQTTTQTTTSNFATNLKYNPTDNKLTTNINGNAATATLAEKATKADSATGDSGTIRDTYLADVSLSNYTLTFKNGTGSNKKTITLTDLDEKVKNTVNNTTKAYVTGTTSATTNTGGQIFDTGVYLGATAGHLHAAQFNGDLVGDVTGTASLATQAQYAEGDKDTIRDTYIKGISGNGKTITYTYGSGSTNSTTIADPTVTQTKDTNATALPILVANSTNGGTAGVKYAEGVTITPSTKTIKADYFDGNAKSATNAVNATTATNAEYAQGDADTIRKTYIKEISGSGKTITYKKGDGTSATTTIADPTVTQNTSSTNSNYPILFSSSTSDGDRITYFNSGVTINPSSKTVKADTFDGNATSATKATSADIATKATNDSAGKNIRDTYLSSVDLTGYTLTKTNGTGTKTEIGDIAVLGSDGKVPMEILPEGVVPTMMVVENHDEMLALTKDDVQNGDVVLVKTDATENILHYVKDDTKLGTANAEEAFQPFIANIAATAAGDSQGLNFRNGYANKLTISGQTLTLKSPSGANLSTITIPKDPTVLQTVTTSNATYPLLLAPNGQTATATTGAYFDSGVTLNPSTNTIAANVSGNAATATKATLAAKATALETGRNIGITGGALTSTTALFDGTSAVDISVTGVKEAYLEWGGKNFSGSYGCIDAAMVPELGANRFAFIDASAIVTEYSTDGGSTWSTYSASDAVKINMFNGNGANLVIGASSATGIDKSKYMLRVTVNTGVGNVYSVLNKFVIYCSTNGSSGSYCTIQGRLQSNYTAGTDTWKTFADKVPISGWSGYNVINTSGITTYGNNASVQYGQVRFTFGVTSHPSSSSYSGLVITKIMGFGGVGWTTPSTMAKNGNIFTYDYAKNVTFPANLAANLFYGDLDGNASTATKLASAKQLQVSLASTSSQTFDGSAPATSIGVSGVLKIGNGGTGATSAAGVLTNLGITATASELNVLDGITATTAELNYLDGVSGNIQTQLGNKLPNTTKYALGDAVGGKALQAIGDEQNQAITSYIRGLAASGKTITYTYGSGSTGTVTIADPTVTQTANTGATALPILIANSAADGTAGTKYVAGVTITPSTKTITATTFAGNASTATKLATARNLQVNLTSTSSKAFDGSASVTDIGVTGTLPIANGGTGATSAAGVLTNLGITATVTELNYVDGVTSNIQTQLNGKASTSAATTSANGLMSSTDKKNMTYFVAGTQTAATNAWTGTLSAVSAPYDGLTIRYYLPYAGTSSGATLSLNGGTSYPVFRYGRSTQITTHFAAGSIITMTFRSSYSVSGTAYTNAWIADAFYNSDTNTKVTNTLNTTTKAYITGTTSATTNTGTQIFDTGVYLDTTAGQLVATTFKGALSGNATTATTASKLGTSTVGTALAPIYLSGGVATTCTMVTSGNYFGALPTIGADGVMEVGKYIDFHITDTATTDYDVRLTAASGSLTCSGSITATSFVGNASSATKATQDGNGNVITSTYLPLAGGTLTGRLTANGKITLPSTGSSWITGMTLTNASIGISTQQTASAYHPYFAVKTAGGHVANIGGLNNEFGFYGFKSGRTDNGIDWYFKIDTATGNVSATGTLSASKVYNAVWNDYAELFPRGENTEAGDIIALDIFSEDEKYIKATKGCKALIGVHSDEYGHLIGGDEGKTPEENLIDYIPIGLAGRVWVKVHDEPALGDYITASEIPGVGEATEDRNLAIGIVVAKKQNGKVKIKII